MKTSKRQVEDVGEWLTMHEVEAMVRAYVDDVAQIVAYFADAPLPSVDDNEPHDTERPPPMFSDEEINTLSPVVTVLGDAEVTPVRRVPRFDTPDQLRWPTDAKEST